MSEAGSGPPQRHDESGAPRRRAGLAVGLVIGFVVLSLVSVTGLTALTDSPTAAPTPTPSPTQAASPTPAREAESPAPGAARTPPVTVATGLEVHVIDVGQGDATLLRTDDATVLVDTGRHDRQDVVPYLREVGVEFLDVVVVTHPHADHLGQFDRVLDTFDVAEVWWSGAVHTTQTFDRAVDALAASEAAYAEPREGDSTEVGDLVFEFVNPPPDVDPSDLHDSGLAFRVTYGETRVLFTGDAEIETERRMIERHAELLAADIYQVGHHGSSTSTTAEFLEAVSPRLAVYSAAVDSQYGHPHDEVVERLTAAGVTLLGTPEHGTVVISSDGTRLDVQTARNQPAFPRPEEDRR